MLSLSIHKLCTHSQSSYGVYTLQAHVWFKQFFILTLSTHVSGFTLQTVTLQAHVRFKIYKFSREIIFFMLTLSTHVSGFTLHTDIWFTLSKHMLGSKLFNYSREIICSCLHSPRVSGFTLHTVNWFTLSKHMLGSKFSNFHKRSFFHAYTLHTCFRVHSPYSYLVYTLQAHVRFKSFTEVIFFMLTLSTHVSGFTLHTDIWFTLSKYMLGSKLSNFHER